MATASYRRHRVNGAAARSTTNGVAWRISGAARRRRRDRRGGGAPVAAAANFRFRVFSAARLRRGVRWRANAHADVS